MQTVVKQEDVRLAILFLRKCWFENNTKSIENLVGYFLIEAAQQESSNRALKKPQAEVAQLDMTTVDYQVKSQELARMTDRINT